MMFAFAPETVAPAGVTPPRAETQDRDAPVGGARAEDIWVLLGNRNGDNRLIETLGSATGASRRTFPLRFNPLGALQNILPRGSLFTLRPAARALIAPPWPRLVITSGKRAGPVALWIRAASGGRTKLVHVGRPQAPLGWFDLVVTTPQYRLPACPNVTTYRFPPTAPTPQDEIRSDLAALPRPRLLAILGGDAPPFRLDATTAGEIAADALARTRRSGGSLLVATSPRTSRTAADALTHALQGADVPVRLSVFGRGANDYRAFLAAADECLVTNESVSMVVEAAMTGAPVTLHRLPERPGLHRRIVAAVLRAMEERSATHRLPDRLVAIGVVRSNADIAGYMQGLESDGLLAGGGEAATLAASELADAAERVIRLIGKDP